MKNLGRASRITSGNNLLNLLTTEFDNAHQAYDLFDEFLQQKTYNKSFCLRLLTVAKQRTGVSWNIRRLAVLMIEHQILMLNPDNLEEFDFLLIQLNLKRGSGLNQAMVSSLLKEGYSTTDLRQFIPELRRKLERLNRVHNRIKGKRTSAAALHDFIALSRCDCKLSLARYLFTPEEVVAEILRQLLVTDGVRDPDTPHPRFAEDEMPRAINLLPDFEAVILKRLCETSNIYWVSDATSSEINSLIEYPTTTVVLVIKPPGSDIEFEIKRAGLRGRHSLNVVYARDGYTVPPSHRLDGGSMQWLLQYEAQAASRFGLIYRRVHGTEAPMANYVSRSSVYAIPTQQAQAQTLTYFTEPRIFGAGYREMRGAMQEVVAAFKTEGYEDLPEMPGALGLSAHFIGYVTPAQAILSGTSSFRLNKLAAYLSSDGPEQYFKKELGVAYSNCDARRLADAILEEVLGSYQPPNVRYRSYKQYLAAAFSVAENRARADSIYLSLLQQIAMFWGTLLAVKGYSRGESFVARNVGLKSFWGEGQWKVRIIFMDHDALVVPGPKSEEMHVHHGLPSMSMDERYVWGRSKPELFPSSEVGYLQSIYRVGNDLDVEGQALAQVVLKDAYRKTQHQMLTNQRLRSLFNKVFIERLLVLDTLVGGYLQAKPDMAMSRAWKEEMKKMLAAKGYGESSFDAYIEIIEKNREFLERYSFLFDLESGQGN
jgi:hypothetical protein